MNRLVKVILIVALVLVIGGMAVGLTSLAMGANPNVAVERLEDWGLVNNIHLGNRNQQATDQTGANQLDSPTLPTDPADSGAAVDAAGVGRNNQDEDASLPEQDVASIPAGAYEIKNVYMDFGAGDIKVVLGDDFSLEYGNNDSRDYFYERVDGDTWYLGSDHENKRWLWPLFDGLDSLKLTVTLPRDFVAEDAAIYIGAGAMKVERLLAATTTLDVGMGSLKVDDLQANEASLHVGMGEITVKSFHAASSSIDTGMGSINLKVTEDLALYRADISVGLGNVRFGENNYTGNSSLQSGNSDAPYSMEVDCGMGHIDIRKK